VPLLACAALEPTRMFPIDLEGHASSRPCGGSIRRALGATDALPSSAR